MQSAYLQFQLTPKVLLQTLDSDDTLQQPNIYIYNTYIYIIYIDKYRAWASQMTEVSNQEKHYEERSLAAWLSQPLTALSDRGFFLLAIPCGACCLFGCLFFLHILAWCRRRMSFHGSIAVFTAKWCFTAKGFSHTWFSRPNVFSRPNGFHGHNVFSRSFEQIAFGHLFHGQSAP